MNRLTVVIAVFVIFMAFSNWYSAYSMEGAYVGTIYEHDPGLRASIQSKYDFAVVEIFLAVAMIGGAYLFERRGGRRGSHLSRDGHHQE